MSGGEETPGHRARDLAETDPGTVAGARELSYFREPSDEMKAGERPGSPGEVASYHEFSDALVEVGLIDAGELKRFAVDPEEGVLGLSRRLVKAGKLTAYQAAAVYQKKSRGLSIGNYLILDKLGKGGMGTVFKARHRTLGRVGALKILPPSFTRDRGAVLRFRREFEAAGRLRHLNLVAAFEAAEDRGVHFLVMDYVEGINLDRVVREHGPLPVAEAVDFLLQSARGLEAAHEQGIVHRDIKPGNLMLDCQGTVRVLDLGLARIVDAGNAFDSRDADRLTQTGMYMGTVDYMAPEQAEDSHSADHRADIYSLGCTFYFLLTGRVPFPGPSLFRRMVAHQERPAPSLRAIRPDVSPAVEAAYRKLMAKRPEDRPASMSEVIALLQAAKPSTDDAARPVAPPPDPNLPEAVTSQMPLEPGGPPRTTIDSSIFARRAGGEEVLSDHELNLRDLVMEVASDVYATGEARADGDESKGTGDDHEWNLRELALELGKEGIEARAPTPPGAAAGPPKGMSVPPQEVTPLGALMPCAASPPPKPAPGPRPEAMPPAVPNASAAEIPPPKRTVGLRQQFAPPAVPKPPAATKQPLKPAPVPRREAMPPAVPKASAAEVRVPKRTAGLRQQVAQPPAPKPAAAEERPPERAAAMRFGESAPNKVVAILAVVTAILLVVAVVVTIARRPSVVQRNESSAPASDSVGIESSSHVAPVPPAQPAR
jgi:serine/threonine protein kinase